MNEEIIGLLLIDVACLVGAAIVLSIAYIWGCFAVRQSVLDGSNKWKAYALAVLPAAAFAVTIYVQGSFAELAGRSFFVLSAPSVVGVFFKFKLQGAWRDSMEARVRS
jgi:hypothetical protein